MGNALVMKNNESTIESIDALLDMIEIRRPDGTKTEEQWIEKFILPLGMERDQANNLYKRVGEFPIMWSSHTDTVHRMGGIQKITYSDGKIRVADNVSNCLGGDCTAGVWMMREMIMRQVPGLYIFHRGEEVGGIGSGWIKKNNPDFVKGIKAAVAFDRRGTSSIITHQWAGRSCSDDFGTSLAGALNMKYKLDDGGTFTDTANYIDLVGECTNVSIGFENEHRSSETVDIKHLLSLREAISNLDFSKLVFKRAPGEADFNDWRRIVNYTRHYTSYTPGWSQLSSDDVEEKFTEDQQEWNRELAGTANLLTIVKDHPIEVAEFLEEYGVTAEELYEVCYYKGAVLPRRFRDQ